MIGSARMNNPADDPFGLRQFDEHLVPQWGIPDFVLREACACGSGSGRVETRNGQDCVFCVECGAFRYNAPKHETGRVVRSASARDDLKPKQKARILTRGCGRCELCGKTPDGVSLTLHVGHIVSVADGKRLGLAEDLINCDDNLMALCSECNLGISEETISLVLAVNIIRARKRRSSIGTPSN